MDMENAVICPVDGEMWGYEDTHASEGPQARSCMKGCQGGNDGLPIWG